MNSPFEHLKQEAATDLADSNVGLLGCGSVGSHAAWLLAGAGVGTLKMLDRDRLEAKNLRRHICGRSDVGSPKAAAVARFIGERFFSVSCIAEDYDALEEPERFARWLEELDLLIVAVDREGPKYLADALCRERKISAIYGGVYGAGWAAELILTQPDGTCYGCIAKMLGRFGVEADIAAAAGYAVPAASNPSGWIAADITSIQPAGSLMAQLAVSVLQSLHGQSMARSEWPGQAWRLPFRSVPSWGGFPWQRIAVEVQRQTNCLICQGEDQS